MYPNSKTKNVNQAGYLLVLVLVLGSVFLVIISSFVGYVVTQNQVVNFRHEQQRATDIAEAGLNYYKWFLAHYPEDTTNGTGQPGPYVHQYQDPEGDYIGEFSLDIDSNTYCGEVSSIEVTSTAHTYVDPSAVSVVSARYTRPTVAEYSFITNGATWYGDDRVITGPVHSNQGIRMDGSHNSFVGSGLTDWTCDSSFGCSTNQTVDGVFTSTANASPGLFSFPTSPVDFAGITLDLALMKNLAEDPGSGGIYYGPSGGYGYRVTFNGDEVTVRRVNNTYNYYAYSNSEGWHTGERNVIASESFIANRNIDPDCPLLFFEDKVWLEGDISEKVTIAAANLSSGSQTNIVLNNNIEYVDGSEAGLLAIAEDDVDVGLYVPNNMRADGIYIAQNGRFGRNHYCESCSSGGGWWSTNYGLPDWLDPYVTRNSLTRYGSVISNGRVGTQWTSGGVTISGFLNRDTSFDSNQVDNPPPLTPQTSDVYIFEDWNQEG
jgi:hypothetical protein